LTAQKFSYKSYKQWCEWAVNVERTGQRSMKCLLQEYKGHLTLLIFILVMALFTIYGDRGLIHLSRLNQDIKKIEVMNENLRHENKLLKREIFLLKNNREYLEETIRKEVGLVRENETIYQFKK
jgi:cell division protein FtsB